MREGPHSEEEESLLEGWKEGREKMRLEVQVGARQKLERSWSLMTYDMNFQKDEDLNMIRFGHRLDVRGEEGGKGERNIKDDSQIWA